MTLTLNGHDVYGPEPKITITRTPDTDEFNISVVAGSVGTVTVESVGECGAVSIASFEGSGTFDEYGVFLVFTGTLSFDREFLCGVPAVEDLVRADWEIFVPITEVGLEGVFESFSYSMPGVPVPVGSPDDESEATSDLPDDFEGGEELDVAPPVTPVECLLADNSSRDIIGVITAVSGEIEIQRDVFGDFESVSAGSVDAQADPSLVASTFLVRQGDIVRARDDSFARMAYFEKAIPLARLADSQGTALSALLEAGVAQIDILPETVICLDEYTDQATSTNPMIDMLIGAIRWTTDRGFSGSGFSTRVGTTTLGGRGTEFLVGYDRATGQATVIVDDGMVEMVNGSDRVLIEAGSWAMSRDGEGIVAGPTTIDEGAYDSVLSSSHPLNTVNQITDDGQSGFVPIAAVVGAFSVFVLVAVVRVRSRNRRRTG